MCTLLFALGARPDARLIVAANRDEFRGRPSAPLHAWEDAPVIAGRDLRGGGTWMGVGRRGRWAALTNTREPGRARPGARSRGELVTEALTAAGDLEAILQRIAARAGEYDGFNLVAWDGRRLWWLSSFAGAVTLQEVAAGVHGLSNHLLDTPWPKVQVGRDRLAALAARPPPPEPDDLLGLLADRRGFADERLPDTGVGLERERELAPLLIDTPLYGTRSSTAMIVDRRGHVRLAELTLVADDRGGPSRVAGRVDLTLDLAELAGDP